MLTYKKFAVLFVLSACLSQTSCLGTFSTPPGPDPAQLLAAAHQYGQSEHADRTASAEVRTDTSAKSSQAATLEDEPTYRRKVAATFNEWDFAQLENEIREARASKGRLVGGAWKVYEFYNVVSQPSAETNATDSEWTNHLETLKQWKAAEPNSAAAQIALAQAYVNYAWAVRGSGYANTVSAGRWNVFAQRLGKAASALLSAASLKEKCPYWYEALQQVAVGQGWSKSEARELFEQASAFEPSYYHYYREYAYYLLPKWSGAPGETQAFAKEAADRVGGEQGDFLYFELASVAVCSCDSDKPAMPNLSWTRIKSGYAVLSRLYGVSDLKANRYALMAYAEDDKASAREAFAKAGDDPNVGIWRSRQSFEDTKVWATTP